MMQVQDPSIIASQWGMINDQWRNSFFRNHLHNIAKDAVVLDVGTGTGLLAFYALEAGAKFVYAVERHKKTAELAEFTLSQCFDPSRFKVINCDFWSSDIDNLIPVESIDILLSETLGPGLFDQGMVQTWHCAKPFLKSTAISLPDRLHCDLHHWHRDVKFEEPTNPVRTLWEENLLGANFAKAIQQYIDKDTSTKHITRWVELKKTHESADNISFNILNITKDTLPPLVFHETYIESQIEFEIDITIAPATIALVNKMSFGDDTLYLQDAQHMPWKYSPVIKFNEIGKYRIRHNPSLRTSHDKWLVNKID
jgi:SAM-dependent methyltransferase